MEWKEYVSQLLSSGDNFENLTISLDAGKTITDIPPIIRASIEMLDKMIEHQGKLNFFVFPEKMQSIFIFSLMKVFHNISEGKIKSFYDPTGFSRGEKLKVGNAIVEYLGIEERDGKTCIMIRLADLNKCSTPIENMPIFQRVDTKRRLSKYKQFSEARNKALDALKGNQSGNENLAYAAEMKTHMDSSIVTMTSVTGAREQLTSCLVNGKKVSSVFYMGKTDYEGTVTNISPGQITGIPAIVFASDLYAVSALAENGHPIQSIIIDASNSNELLNQLDALDEIIRLDAPVVCITDVANSFELGAYADRGFNIWRWDNNSLTEQLYDAVPLVSDGRIRNCAKQSITYLKTDGMEISDSMRRLSSHRKETENQSPQIMKVFEFLNNLTFSALRATIPLTEPEIETATHFLDECESMMKGEYQYVDEGTYSDYMAVITNLRKVYSKRFSFPKIGMLQSFLKKHGKCKIVLIIPERSPKSQIQGYWTSWCLQHFIKARVLVLFPSEYYSLTETNDTITVICGWLKRVIMRKIIYSFCTSEYAVLLYDYENRWKNHDANRWKKALNDSSNKKIIEKSFSSEGISVSTVRYDPSPDQPDDLHGGTDELNEIELILRSNKYRQYESGGSSGGNAVPAIPVNFVGGYFAFYRTGHRVISATRIIMSDADKIETKFPVELRVGDFVVIRETDRDIVREIADVALANSGKENLRLLASKWREAIQIELLFCTVDDFCAKVKDAGCEKSLPTIRRWIEDEDVIAPRSKDDLRILAEVTENETLIEMLDSIYDAAQEIRNAHVLAGRKLSEQLKKTLAAELKKNEEIDPFNFWEPIDLEVEGIGVVKVLKIIDIGAEVVVNITDTNHLIGE